MLGKFKLAMCRPRMWQQEKTADGFSPRFTSACHFSVAKINDHITSMAPDPNLLVSYLHYGLASAL